MEAQHCAGQPTEGQTDRNCIVVEQLPKAAPMHRLLSHSPENTTHGLTPNLPSTFHHRPTIKPSIHLKHSQAHAPNSLS